MSNYAKVYWTANNLQDLSGLFSLMQVEPDSTIAAEVVDWIRLQCGHNRTRLLSPCRLILQWDTRRIDLKASKIQFF